MGTTGSKEVADKPVVVVVGGGFGGTVVAKALDAKAEFNVVLIDRKDYFLHNIAGLRAAVDKDWAERIMVPYTKLLRHGTVVHAEVTEVGPKGVLVNGREEAIKFNYLILATGSSYAFPAKIAEPTREEALKKYHEMADIIGSVKRVLIVGGGPVGIELAGEIVETHPEVEVTLVHSDSQLLNSALSDKFRLKLQDQLQQLGVTVVLGEKVDFTQKSLKSEVKGSPNYFIHGKRKVTTDKGTKIRTDLIFVCTGIITNNKSFTAQLSDALDSGGRLKVNPHFQVEGHENIFAIGDCCDMEAKMAFYAKNHAGVVARNIQILQHNESSNKTKPLEAYEPAKYPMMCVTIGSKGGAGQFPTKGAMLVGPSISSMMKGKTLFVKPSWALNNQKFSWDDPQLDTSIPAKETKLRNLAAALGISEEDADEILESPLPPVDHEGGETRT